MTPLNLKISFVFNAQIKTTVEQICHNRAEKNMSLDIVIISNKPIKLEIVNACNHRVTNNVIILLASLDCCKRDVSKLVLLLTSEILHYEQFNI